MPPEDYISGLGVMAWGTQPATVLRSRPTRPRMTGEWFLMSVWCGGRIRQEPPSFEWLQREFIAPQLGERVELKVGWPTVKVPFVMVWGFKCSFLSFFYSRRQGALKLSGLA